jgi:hypothetical protein
MSSPTVAEWLQHDACARYLNNREIVIVSLEPDFSQSNGEVGGTLLAYSDADWA